jgi:hypothetical protein
MGNFSNEHERNILLRLEKMDRFLEVAQESMTSHYLVRAILLAAEHGASLEEIITLKWEVI